MVEIRRRNAFCTVLAANYIASARTLCESLRNQHSGCEIFALFIDDPSPVLSPGTEPFTAVLLEQLGLPDASELCFKYDVVELATAVKPQFFKFLFTTYAMEKLLFLDPDVFVLNSLDQVLHELDLHDILLTPHIDTDFPEDGFRPDTTIPLTYGLYNLGFLGLRNSSETIRFLEWWHRKIGKNCTRDRSSVYYVDQKVVDLVPFLFRNVLIARSPGYNVAYWNIHSRRVEMVAGQWRCNDAPLYFFHFSGFDPEQPQQLSRDMTRPLQVANEAVITLLRTYKARLSENGYAATSRLPYGHSRFADGEEILYETRRSYRLTPPEAARCDNPFRSKTWIAQNRRERFLQNRPRVRRLLRVFQRIVANEWWGAPRGTSGPS